MKKVIVLLLIVLPFKLVSQSCNSNSLYDAIVSAYHQSVAQKSDGSWSGWGAVKFRRICVESTRNQRNKLSKSYGYFY